MTEAEVIDIGVDALWVLIKTAAPLMLVALAVGLVVSLFQALTQIQEMTLTFVPKILAMFLVMMVAMPFMLDTLRDFSDELFLRIADTGQAPVQAP